MGKCSEKVLRNLQRDCDCERTVYIGKYSQNHMAPTKYLSSLRRKSVQVLGLMPNRFTITMHEIKKVNSLLITFPKHPSIFSDSLAVGVYVPPPTVPINRVGRTRHA